MPTRRLALGTLPFALLTGCRSPDPVLYTLQPVPGPPRKGGPRMVAVRDVALAGYLDRLPIVKSALDYRLTVSNNDWWGEPLQAMLTRTLVENLAQRLPRATVFPSTGAISVAHDAAIEVNVQRLGTVEPGSVTLLAQVAVGFQDSRRPTLSRTENIAQPLTGASTQEFVAAASAALGRLADAIAALLVG